LVVDTSAILVLLFNEPDASWVADVLRANAMQLLMSTVNYAELLILLRDRQPQLFTQIKRQFDQSTIRVVAPTREHAEIAADARIRFPLNLGDCFAYALAKSEGLPLLTFDRDFRATDIQVVFKPGHPHN
jgi:ribonuclease VapC